jgi:CyaY protein
MMDESSYQKLVARTFRRVEDALADVDPDVCEISATGDMLTLLFANRVKVILNTQRAVRQLWLAARATAWHFSYDAAGDAWLDDKGRGDLWSILRSTSKELSGQDIIAP